MAHYLSAESIRLKMRLRTGHRPRQGQRPNDGKHRGTIRLMQHMHIPERNNPLATSVWCLCGAFRNRGASGGASFSLERCHGGMTSYTPS
jgi:hypothetical protein